MLYQKRILVAPLNWGLGHATRCIPIIQELLLNRAEVIIGADQLPLKLLRTEFPDLEYIEFPGMEITYKSNSSLIWNMALQANKFYKSFSEEQVFLQKAVKNYAIDAVISDNRYGAFSTDVPCFFITHQLFLNLPIGKKVMDKVIKNYISNFDECWIPDFPGSKNLSGDLSHRKNLPGNYHFVGPLSRFSMYNVAGTDEPERKLMIILSGPEPNRTELENLLLKQLENIDFDVLMVRGTPGKIQMENNQSKVKIEPFLTTDILYREITSSEIILSRSGYSTIMDMAALGKKAILIPTKGQPEQEYLAEKLSREGIFYSVEEKNLDLLKALEKCRNYSGIKLEYNNNHIVRRIRNILNYSKK